LNCLCEGFGAIGRRLVPSFEIAEKRPREKLRLLRVARPTAFSPRWTFSRRFVVRENRLTEGHHPFTGATGLRNIDVAGGSR